MAATAYPLAHERATLRHMLAVRTPEGLPVVCAEALLREFVDDLSTAVRFYRGSVAELQAWADGHEDWPDQPQRLSFCVNQAYRIMVGAHSYGFHPDWLCALPSPAWGTPAIGAWDRSGRRIV